MSRFLLPLVPRLSEEGDGGPQTPAQTPEDQPPSPLQADEPKIDYI